MRAQRLTRGEQTGLHRADGGAGGFGDFSYAHLLAEIERGGDALLQRQRRHGLGQIKAGVGAARLVSARTWRLPFKRLPEPLTAVSGPEGVRALAVRDGVKPGAQPAGIVEPAQSAPGADQSFLHRILTRLPVRQHARGERLQLRRPAPRQLGEGLARAGLSAQDEILVQGMFQSAPHQPHLSLVKSPDRKVWFGAAAKKFTARPPMRKASAAPGQSCRAGCRNRPPALRNADGSGSSRRRCCP